MLKNTLNFKINFIVKLYDIFEENSCPNCLVYFFWSYKDIWSFGIWYSDIFAKGVYWGIQKGWDFNFFFDLIMYEMENLVIRSGI